jgi:hypothetical protein
VSIIKPPTPGLEMSPFIRAMMKEGDELAQKMARLNAFRETDDFKALAPLDAHTLVLQGEAMQLYLHILTIRLARANDAARGIVQDQARALNAMKQDLSKPN